MLDNAQINTATETVTKQAMDSLNKWLIERLEDMRALDRILGLEVEDDITDFAKRIALTYTLVYEPTEDGNGTKVTLLPKSALNTTKED